MYISCGFSAYSSFEEYQNVTNNSCVVNGQMQDLALFNVNNTLKYNKLKEYHIPYLLKYLDMAGEEAFIAEVMHPSELAVAIDIKNNNIDNRMEELISTPSRAIVIIFEHGIKSKNLLSALISDISGIAVEVDENNVVKIGLFPFYNFDYISKIMSIIFKSI